jgi:hypothetical protein
MTNTPPEDPTKPPKGSFGYCAGCYHPLDVCSHCDSEVAILREFLETMREHGHSEAVRLKFYLYLQMAMKAARERKG